VGEETDGAPNGVIRGHTKLVHKVEKEQRTTGGVEI
jgi:hypothetical protein